MVFDESKVYTLCLSFSCQRWPFFTCSVLTTTFWLSVFRLCSVCVSFCDCFECLCAAFALFASLATKRAYFELWHGDMAACEDMNSTCTSTCRIAKHAVFGLCACACACACRCGRMWGCVIKSHSYTDFERVQASGRRDDGTDLQKNCWCEWCFCVCMLESESDCQCPTVEWKNVGICTCIHMHTKSHAYAIACTNSHTRSFIHSLVHAHTTATWMGRSWYLKTWRSSSCRRRIIHMSLSPPRPRLLFLALALTPSYFLLSRSLPPATLR